jgi:hypothetical protein
VHETKVYFTEVSPKGPALERFPNIKIKKKKKKKIKIRHLSFIATKKMIWLLVLNFI